MAKHAYPAPSTRRPPIRRRRRDDEIHVIPMPTLATTRTRRVVGRRITQPATPPPNPRCPLFLGVNSPVPVASSESEEVMVQVNVEILPPGVEDEESAPPGAE